jgi:hypothetical protein
MGRLTTKFHTHQRLSWLKKEKNDVSSTLLQKKRKKESCEKKRIEKRG